MDVLEAREQQLHKQLFGAHGTTTSYSSTNASITYKTSDLNARLEHLYGAVAGFSRLHDMYTGVQKELELQPSSTLGSSAPRAGEEIKRAVILSSEDRIDEVVREFRKLKEMECVLAQLEQLRSRNSVDESQLQTLERSADLQTQRALALHARVERVLAIYHEMIQTLSENACFDTFDTRKAPCSAVAKQPLGLNGPIPQQALQAPQASRARVMQRLSLMTQTALRHDARMRRRHVKTRVRQLLGATFVVVACCAGMLALFSRAFPSSNLSTTTSASGGRLLAESTTNATTSSEEGEDESCAGLADWELNGGIVVYICALLYLFVALAIICDDYFVSALEKITDALGLSKDVAGATFMAAGSSAPELFVSLADNVFAKPEASLGIGTIVGSAIFNILIIIALSALLAGQHLVLDWRPLLRDSIWYTWSIIALTISVWDESVDVYESAMLFGSYACYILYMSQNERVVNKCCKRPDDIEFSDDAESNKETGGELSADDALAAQQAAAMVATAAAGTAPLKSQTSSGSRPWTIDVERVEKRAEGEARLERKTSESSAQLRRTHSSAQDGDPRARFADASSKVNPIYQSKYRMFQYHPSMSRQNTQNSLESDAGRTSSVDKSAVDASAVTTVSSAPGVQEVDMHEEGQEQLGGYFDELFDVPESLAGKAWFVFTRPIVIIARLTIPDCRYPQFSGTCGFTATFIVAIIWIAFLSHYTVVWATKFGCIAGIPSALMGLTIIAAGTSIPDALSSILVARDGHGDMAVSNALGSNVFDILLGLGLPFFISNLVYGEPVPIAGDDLELSIFILFGVLLMLVAMLIASKWRLRPIVGAFLLSLYVAYVVVTYLRGLGMI